MSLVPLAPPPPDYQQGWVYLAWKRIVAVVLSFTEEAIGFTISGGATSKTLTVPLDATVSGTNTGDNAGVTSITVTGANGIGVSGSPITSSGTIALSLGAITPTSLTTPTIYGSADANGDLTIEGTSSATKTTSYVNLQPTGGNVGIGVTNPLRTLSINGNVICGTAAAVGTTVPLNISMGGTYGINVAGSPGNLKWTMYDDGLGETYGIGMSANKMEYQLPSTGNHVFFVNGVESARFASNLNLSVGSGALPNDVITVGSSASSTGIQLRSSILPTNGSNYSAGRILSGFLTSGGYNNTFLDLQYPTADNTFSTALRSINETIIIGTTLVALGSSNKLQVQGTTAATNSLGISAWSADALGSRIELGKSRGAAIGTNTIVQDGDVVGSLLGYGANGSTFTNLASIGMEVDGTPGATNDMPGRIVFKTTPNGSGTLTEAMRLSQDQTALFASSIKTAAPTTGTSAPWKLGTLVTGQVGLVVLSTQYLEVDVSGTLIKLATI